MSCSGDFTPTVTESDQKTNDDTSVEDNEDSPDDTNSNPSEDPEPSPEPTDENSDTDTDSEPVDTGTSPEEQESMFDSLISITCCYSALLVGLTCHFF